MKGIIKLVLADMKYKKGSFIGVAFLMMLIVMSFTGSVSNSDDLMKAINMGFEQADCGDLIVRVYTDMLTEDIHDTIDSNSHVSRTEYKETLLMTQKPLVDGEEKEILMELSAYSGTLLVFNDDFSALLDGIQPTEGEIYLPYKMKTLIEKNSEVIFSAADDTKFSFTVKGYYEDPMFGTTAVSSNVCVINEADHKRVLEHSSHITDNVRKIMSCSDINIHIADGFSPYELKKQLNDECSLIDISIYSPTKEDLADNIKVFSNVGTRMAYVYVAILIVIVIIIMANSISSTIEMDYTSLGILKSQGFSQWQIRMLFVIEYAVSLTIGAISGLILSFPACGALIRLFMRLTGMLTATDISVGKCALLSLGIIIICMVFVFAATAKIGRISPVRAIQGGKDEVYFDSRLNVPIRRKLLSLLIALRQITSNIRNYFGAVSIVTVLIFFLVSISAFVGGFDADAIFTGMSGDIELTNLGSYSLSDKDKTEDIIHSIDSGATLRMECRHRMNIDGQQVTVSTYSREEDYFKAIQGRIPRYYNEIMLTKSVARSVNKQIGDTVTVKYLDTELDFVMTGYFQTVSEYGVYAMTTPEGMDKLGFTEINSAFITLSDKSAEKDMIKCLNDSFENVEAGEMKESETITKYKALIAGLMDIIAYVFYGMSVIFAAVIVIMMTRTAFLRERIDLGIYKAMGMTSSVLRIQFALRFFVLSVTGSVLGGIVSVLLTQPMLEFMLRAVGLTDFATGFDVSMLILPSVIVSFGIFAAAYLSSNKIKQIEVRELITE
ncbi:ABC transporter permease [Ruminococcus sp.]|uniref:ABC transporter permease n=1 Tax=Ruminococcus sp. TaxID=41978 RepID=UPI0025D06C7D|nr:ABC transporter permease [Ruminococcus sp.]MBR1431013.1 FtsX-like permease family protein [Ruminococcus sp.]